MKLLKYPVDFHFPLTLTYSQGAAHQVTSSTNPNCLSNPLFTTASHNVHVPLVELPSCP